MFDLDTLAFLQSTDQNQRQRLVETQEHQLEDGYVSRGEGITHRNILG